VSTAPSARSTATVLLSASTAEAALPTGAAWQGSTTAVPSADVDGRPSVPRNHDTDAGPSSPAASVHARGPAGVLCTGSATLATTAPVVTDT